MNRLYIFYAIVLLLISSCGVIPQQQSVAPTIQNNAAQSADITNPLEHDEATRTCPTAYSTDVAFVSDPLFALHFITDDSASYSSFYAMALKKTISATMFVTAEESSAYLFDFPIERLPTSILKTIKPLSSMQETILLAAKRVVISPLLPLFAPQLFDILQAYRSRCNLPNITQLDAGLPQHTTDTISIRYAPAIQQLAKYIVAYMKKENTNLFFAVLDTQNIHVVQNISLLLGILYDTVPNFSPTLLWDTRVPDSEAQIYEHIDSIPYNAAILLYAGQYTLRASQYLYQRNSLTIERVFAITTWESLPYTDTNTFSYGLYARAWVAASLSSLFENNSYATAKIYRLNTVTVDKK